MTSFKNKDPDECLVMCTGCNGYLHSISKVESGGKDVQLVSCPHWKMGKCEPRSEKRS